MKHVVSTNVIAIELSVNDVRPVHPLKAVAPILDTDNGIVIEVRPVHPLNVLVPILVIVALKTIDVNVVLFVNAELPNEVMVAPAIVAGILRIGGNVPADAVIDPDETVKLY